MADIENIRTFVIAATTGSFTKTAQRLEISPAMVGRRIHGLESEYAVKLIERTTRSQRLTDVGVRFLEKATHVVESLEELADIGRPDSNKLAGKIRISAPRTLGVKTLTTLVARFTESNPDVVIELALSDRNVDLITEGFDLAVRIGHLKSSSLVARRIGTYRFVCCASPRYLNRFPPPSCPEELMDARCILNLNLMPKDRWTFERTGRTVMADVHGSLELDSDEAIRIAALEGAGIIYAPHELVGDDIVEGRLVTLFPQMGTMTLPINAVLPSRQFVPRRVAAVVSVFAELLKETDRLDPKSHVG